MARGEQQHAARRPGQSVARAKPGETVTVKVTDGKDPVPGASVQKSRFALGIGEPGHRGRGPPKLHRMAR